MRGREGLYALRGRFRFEEKNSPQRTLRPQRETQRRVGPHACVRTYLSANSIIAEVTCQTRFRWCKAYSEMGAQNAEAAEKR